MSVSILQITYSSLFALGAVGCGIAAIRARQLSHRDTRVGLIGLLLLSGFWSGSTSIRLQIGDPVISQLFHQLALVNRWTASVSTVRTRSMKREPPMVHV